MPASGEWEDNIEVRGNEIWGRDYTQYLVEGRPPNTDQDPQALRRWAVYAGNTFIKDWANAKGVNIDPIAIAYKIARDGTDYYPQGTDLLDVLTSQEVIDYITEKMKDIVVFQITTQFTQIFK